MECHILAYSKGITPFRREQCFSYEGSPFKQIPSTAIVAFDHIQSMRQEGMSFSLME